MSHQTFTPWSSGNDSSPSTSPPPAAQLPVDQERQRPRSRWIILVLGALFVSGLWFMSDGKDGGLPTAAVTKPAVVRSAAEFPTVPPAAAPPDNRPLTVEEIREAQLLLKSLGFDPGGADGIVGPMTVAAVKRYETVRGWAVAGSLDWLLLQSLRAGKDALASPATRPSPPPSSAPTIVPNEEMRLASRVIKDAGHPCGSVGVAVRLSDGSVRAICTNNEIYRVFRTGGEWVALKCSAAQRMGVQGC